jgi:hypothetical protein
MSTEAEFGAPKSSEADEPSCQVMPLPAIEAGSTTDLVESMTGSINARPNP